MKYWAWSVYFLIPHLSMAAIQIYLCKPLKAAMQLWFWPLIWVEPIAYRGCRIVCIGLGLTEDMAFAAFCKYSLHLDHLPVREFLIRNFVHQFGSHFSYPSVAAMQLRGVVLYGSCSLHGDCMSEYYDKLRFFQLVTRFNNACFKRTGNISTGKFTTYINIKISFDELS